MQVKHTKEIEASLRMGRAYAATKLPFFSEALFAARLVLVDSLPTLAAIDRSMRIYFNPDMIERCISRRPALEATRQLAWVWVHEVSHVMRDHARRGEELRADPRIWNIACDIEINDNEFGDLEYPSNYCIVRCDTYGFEPDRVAEHYYQMLVESREQDPDEGVYLDEGSGIHGESRPWELPFTDSNSPPICIGYQAGLRSRIAEAIRDRARRSTFPSGWIRWAESMCPVVDWRRALQRRLQRAVSTTANRKTNESFHRPHRKATAHAPFIRPSLCGPRQHHLAVVVDTSGSMDKAHLCRCMSEIRGILEATQCTITAIPCDAQAYDPIEILTRSDLIAASHSLRGGGGTDMVAGIAAALKLRPKPDAIIVLTDGYTPYPPAPPIGTQVIFGILHGESWNDSLFGPTIPPWKSSDILRIPIE